MIYRSEFRLLSSDVDPRRRLRLSRLFTLAQEAAIAHTEALGAGRALTLDRGILWILAMQRLRIHRLPEYDEAVALASWPGETMHVLFPRYFRLSGAGGEPLAEGSALWMLMDAQTRQRVFPDAAGIHVPGMDGGPTPPLPRSLPATGGEAHVFEVPYSYVDLNGHMNNARLLDLAEDMMPGDLRAYNVRQIEAEYGGEARPGDRLVLRANREGGLFTLCGGRERPLFKLRMEYEV